MLVQGLVAWSSFSWPWMKCRRGLGDSHKTGDLLSFLLFAKNAYKAAIARLNVEETNYEGIAKLLSKVDQGWHLPEDMRQAVIRDQGWHLPED